MYKKYFAKSDKLLQLVYYSTLSKQTSTKADRNKTGNGNTARGHLKVLAFFTFCAQTARYSLRKKKLYLTRN